MEKQSIITGTDLTARFAATGKRPRHFIAWVADMGFKVEHATISRHEAGTQGITIPWGIAYECFFHQIQNQKHDNSLQI